MLTKAFPPIWDWIISAFAIWIFHYFQHFFFSKPKVLMLSLFEIFLKGWFLCCAVYIHSHMRIQHGNSLEAYIKEIWVVWRRQAYECESPKKNDCMSEGNIKMNSSALPWLHRSVSIRSVHWAGIFHFIHHLQLAAMILQDQSIPLAHTKRNTQNSPC